MITKYARSISGAVLACIGLANITSSVSADSYNKQQAVNYAHAYATSRNYPMFPDFSEDCANFVSQALGMGGWTFRYNNNPDYSWWYGGRHDAFWSYSPSFVNAHQLMTFTIKTGRGVVIGQGVNSNRGRYNDLQPGDLIFCDWYVYYNNDKDYKVGENGWIDHVYIVTGRDSRGILVSAHTTDRRDMPFTDVFNYDLGQKGRFYYVSMRTQY